MNKTSKTALGMSENSSSLFKGNHAMVHKAAGNAALLLADNITSP